MLQLLDFVERFEVLMVMIQVVIWIVMPCSDVVGHLTLYFVSVVLHLSIYNHIYGYSNVC
jgi:hypothetical protein